MSSRTVTLSAPLCHSERYQRSLGAPTPAAKESGAGMALALVPAYRGLDVRPPHEIPRRFAPRNDRREARLRDRKPPAAASYRPAELVPARHPVILSGDWARTGHTRRPRRILGGASDRSRQRVPARRMNSAAPTPPAAQFIARGSAPPVILSGDWARTGHTRQPRRIWGGANDCSRGDDSARRMNSAAPVSAAAQSIARGSVPRRRGGTR